ncbi:Protein ALTERED XYLOGLUCAN 4-like [Bienertia sinuspersici]
MGCSSKRRDYCNKCRILQVETPVDVYKDLEDRFRTWHFPSSNFTLMVFWSKFLVNSQERIINSSSTGNFNLYFDEIDEKWASELPTLDYVIISDGHWFFRKNHLYEENRLIGCIYCDEPNITKYGLKYALRMSFRATLKHINKCKDCKKGMVTLVRTYSPSHFENGAWNTGAGCNRTSPHAKEKANELEKEFEYELELRNLQIEELERAREEDVGQEKKFMALDVTWPMLMRPDGHPNEFTGNKWMKGYNDCTHWCMPGPIDTWNDILLAVLLEEVA